MSLTDPLRREHAELLPRIGDLDVVASSLGEWHSGNASRLAATVEFLRGHLVPHARAEEAVLYPAIERIMGAPGATDTMKADHVEIVRRITQLASSVEAVGAGTATALQIEQLRAQLYGLSAIVHLHFAKEEDVLLPILDARMAAGDAEQMFTLMHAAAHEHDGPGAL